MKLQIEYVDKNDLKAYANNAKIHTAEQIEQIKKSIREFGFNDPIAVWKDNEIIEGHGRLFAVMEMDDIDKIPVIRLDSLTDEQRKAYSIVHNSIMLQTGFDIDLLNIELQEIQEIDMTQYSFTVQPEDIDDDLEQFLIDEELERKEKDKTIVCPYCGRVIGDSDENNIHED